MNMYKPQVTTGFHYGERLVELRVNSSEEQPRFRDQRGMEGARPHSLRELMQVAVEHPQAIEETNYKKLFSTATSVCYHNDNWGENQNIYLDIEEVDKYFPTITPS